MAYSPSTMTTKKIAVHLPAELYNELLSEAVQLKAADDAARSSLALSRSVAKAASDKPLCQTAWAQGPGRQFVLDNFYANCSIVEKNQRIKEAYRSYRAAFKRPPGRPRVKEYAKPLWHYVQQAALLRLLSGSPPMEPVASCSHHSPEAPADICTVAA